MPARAACCACEHNGAQQEQSSVDDERARGDGDEMCGARCNARVCLRAFGRICHSRELRAFAGSCYVLCCLRSIGIWPAAAVRTDDDDVDDHDEDGALASCVCEQRRRNDECFQMIVIAYKTARRWMCIFACDDEC